MKEFNANSITKKSNFILNIIFMIYTLFCLVPLILALIVSFTDENIINTYGYSFFPRKLSFASYQYVLLNGRAIINAYGITIFNTVVGTFLSLIVIALFAYPISRKEFKYRYFFTFLVFFTMLFSGGMVPWYLVCTQVLHLKDTIWAMIIPYLMNGWYVIIMRTFFATTIPDSIVEAAKIDGAGDFKTFMVIVLPLAKPVLATVGLFITLTYWNDFWLPMMLINKDGLLSLQYTMVKIQTNIAYLTQINSAAGGGNVAGVIAAIPTETVRMAMAVMAIGPIVIAYPFFQKYFVKGLTIGAVKG
ncbi:MAG TPA: carbohydrate ABC transporter permease [Clostridiaceae bacterium]